MREAAMPDANWFMSNLLNNACSGPELVDGVGKYWIETHCVGWWVTARQNADGSWCVLNMEPEAI